MSAEKVRLRTSVVAVLFLGMASTSAATECDKWAEFTTALPELRPQTISIDEIQNHINGLQTSEGVIFDIELSDKEIWIDVVYVPDSATAISGVRAIMQIGRLVSGDFTELVLSDDGVGVYRISEPAIREIGCQFIWGQEGGQNPIYLLRVFFENLEKFESGQKAVQGFTGHLLGDTNLAMEYHNNEFVPAWMLSALE